MQAYSTENNLKLTHLRTELGGGGDSHCLIATVLVTPRLLKNRPKEEKIPASYLIQSREPKEPSSVFGDPVVHR